MRKIAIRPTVLLASMAVALPLLAAEKLGAKIGQWETTTTMTMGGQLAQAIQAMPALPPEVLASLPPAQRAQMEQAMATMAGKPVTARSCVTEKDLAEGAFRPQNQQDMQCTYKTISSTSKRQEATFQCTTPTGPADGRLAVDLVNDGHVKGTAQIKMAMGSMDAKFESKWLGASCPASK